MENSKLTDRLVACEEEFKSSHQRSGSVNEDDDGKPL